MSARNEAPAEDYRSPLRREHFVYRAFDASGRLLYVGCTMRLDLRWAEHRGHGTWSFLAERFYLQGPYPYEVARAIERSAIRTEDPEFNVRMSWGPHRPEPGPRVALIHQKFRELTQAGLPFGDAKEAAVRQAQAELEAASA